MIRIKREDCPDSLNKPNCEFREQDYAKADVKAKLLSIQHNKCCYCEIDLDKSGSLMKEVDHYIPRKAKDFEDKCASIQWHLANNWKNLLFSCRNCNNKKRSKHPFGNTGVSRLLIDPTEDTCDPENEISFILDEGLLAHNINGKTTLGGTTTKMLDFSVRTELIGGFLRISMALQKKINELIVALLDYNVSQIESLKAELSRSMSAHYEFAAFRRAFVDKKIQELNQEIIPKLEKRHNKAIGRIEIDFPQGAEVRI